MLVVPRQMARADGQLPGQEDGITTLPLVLALRTAPRQREQSAEIMIRTKFFAVFGNCEISIKTAQLPLSYHT